MSYLNMALGAGLGAVGGATGAHPQQQGPLMNYLRQRMQRQGSGEVRREGHEMPTMGPGDFGGETDNPAIPSAGAPPQNPYRNPYPQRPPMEDPNAPMVPANGQQFADGGIVSEPTTAIIGEDGPEMVIPLSGRPDAKVSPRNAPRMSYGR